MMLVDDGTSAEDVVMLEDDRTPAEDAVMFIDGGTASEDRVTLADDMTPTVDVMRLADHYPICLTWSHKGVKIPKAGHRIITFRSFSKFDENAYLDN